MRPCVVQEGLLFSWLQSAVTWRLGPRLESDDRRPTSLERRFTDVALFDGPREDVPQAG